MEIKPHPVYTDYHFSEDGRCFRNGKELKGTKLRYYRRLSIWVNGVCTKKYLHRLLFETFHGEVPEGCVVMHHDEFLPLPYINGTQNLFLGTISLNAKDTFFKGRKGKGGISYGDNNGMRKKKLARLSNAL
jgi:hypothetical protein